MTSKKILIGNAIAVLKDCIHKGIVPIVTLTEYGQNIDFYDLDREYDSVIPEIDATYSYDRLENGKILDYIYFNKSFY